MKVRHTQPARFGLLALAAIWLLVVIPLSAAAAPYAAMVLDARSGEVLHSRNADTRLHPASLTKMMTLYIAFEAVKNGEITLDTKVRISQNAASEPPSKLGLKAGQRIRLRYLIRAASVKSANDAATAIGEALAGSEAAFARRMNRTAKALGMSNTTFKNAHGLTESGHLSTARDMTTLGRHLLYDYPQYYNLFSRRTTDAGVKKVSNTNRRLLEAYRGADGIKTGYTRAAGFNLVASAERGNERVIATVFGGRSSASRNAKVAELLDLGFRRAPSRVALNRPTPPRYGRANTTASPKPVTLAVTQSLRPRLRPGSLGSGESAPVTAEAKDAPQSEAPATETAVVAAAEIIEIDIQTALIEAQVQPPGDDFQDSAMSEGDTDPDTPQVVTRLSTSGGRHWGINIGRYNSRYAAEKVLLKTALAEMSTLEGSLRKVVENPRGFEANFLGLTRETADLACRRLQARQIACFTIGPS